MSALSGAASADVVALGGFLLPLVPLIALLIVLFEKAVASSVIGERAHLLSRFLNVAIAPLAFGGLAISAAHLASL